MDNDRLATSDVDSRRKYEKNNVLDFFSGATVWKRKYREQNLFF